VWRFGLNTEPAGAKAQEAPPEVPVTPGVVTAKDVPEFLQGIGTVQPFNAVTVKTRVDGPIVEVAFTEGQEIKKGDLLFQIDPRPYEAALELAQATKVKDQAQLETAEADLERYSRLVGSGFQTRQSFDQQKGLVAQLTATIRGDDARIDTARLDLGFTAIRSPIDGRLGARLVDVGNLLHATDNTALVTVSQLQPIFVSFTLPQDTLDGIRQFQKQAPLKAVALSADGTKQLAEGKLTLIDNTIDQSTGTIHLKATFANTDEQLWPGEFVNVRLVLRMRNDVATVPSQTVQQGPNGDFAYVISKENTVERRAVVVAVMQDGMAVVSKGLTPGERVVVTGQYRLTEGTRVKLLPEKQAETAQK
jgi:multidrug efflux system membrane fusion protein